MNRQWSQRLCQQALVSIFLIVLVSCQHHNRLHISITENDLLRYSDKAYVRIYQTVFSAAEGASKTTFPNGITYKDIWQDADGRIIIAPGDSLDNPTWVGIADPRNQLKFISNYKTQVNPADNPLVRSFLVDYETVRNVLNPRRIVTEDPKFKGLGLSLNVDKHAANQFGLNHFDTDEFRKNALPGSLITYTSKSVDQKKYEHWGTIRPVEELYDYLGLPSDDIPGAYSDTHAKERTKGSEMQIDNYLQELETLQQKSKGGANVESVIQDKLKEFNNKYIYEKISTGDLPIEGIDISFEKQKLLKKLKTQITYFEKELSKMYKHANNVLYAEVENKVNEYNEKFRSNVPEQLSPPELPIMKKDAVAVQKQLLSEITKLNELKGRFDAGENVKVELDQRLRKYNDYMTADGRTLTRDDLKNIKAYKEEALARRQISERFYKADLNPTLKNLDEFEWKQIPKIETDPMFTDSKDINMHELLRRGEKFRKQFLGAKKFLAYAESYSNEFNSILKNDRSKDLNRVRNLRNAESLLRNSNDPQFLIRTKYGFLYGSGDFSNDQITRIFNDIGKSVAVLIPNDETRVAVVGKLKTFTDKVTKGLKKVTYHSEIIVQLGDSTEVGEASKYLFNRYTKEYKKCKAPYL